MSNQGNRVEFLDWIRAAAVAMVVVGHAANVMAPGGGIGVSVFFVLSGFLIADILLRDGMLTTGNIAKFIVRRVGRIYPMYLVHLLAIAAYYGFFNPEHLRTVAGILRHMLYFAPSPDHWFGYGIGVLWTLRIEFWFYVTFPLILVVLTMLRIPMLGMVGLIVVSIAYKALNGPNDVIRYYDQFLIGSIAAYLVRFRMLPTFIGSSLLRIAAAGALFALLAVPVLSRGPIWQAQSFTAAMLTGALVLSLYARPPAMRIPALSFIGAISYSIYLVHAIVLDCWVKLFGLQTINMPIFLAIVIAVSYCTYSLIEQPFQRLVHKRVRFSMKQVQKCN